MIIWRLVYCPMAIDSIIQFIVDMAIGDNLWTKKKLYIKFSIGQ